MVMPCRGCLHLQLYFIAALYTPFSRGSMAAAKGLLLVVISNELKIINKNNLLTLILFLFLFTYYFIIFFSLHFLFFVFFVTF